VEKVCPVVVVENNRSNFLELMLSATDVVVVRWAFEYSPKPEQGFSELGRG
jgi:hypothetical protein